MAPTILVVDDDPDILEQTHAILQTAGYDVVEAESAAQAETRLAELAPDMAIVDLMLEEPDSGFTLCSTIKKSAGGIPVIIVSNVARETGIRFGKPRANGSSWIAADAFLDKPVRSEQLLQEVRRLIRR